MIRRPPRSTRTDTLFPTRRSSDLTREAGRQKITEYKARHLMIRRSEVVAFNQAKAKLEALRERALNGESFEELARKYSEDTPTRHAGGDMDWLELDAWGAGVDAQIGKDRKSTHLNSIYECAQRISSCPYTNKKSTILTNTNAAFYHYT